MILIKGDNCDFHVNTRADGRNTETEIFQSTPTQTCSLACKCRFLIFKTLFLLTFPLFPAWLHLGHSQQLGSSSFTTPEASFT